MKIEEFNKIIEKEQGRVKEGRERIKQMKGEAKTEEIGDKKKSKKSNVSTKRFKR